MSVAVESRSDRPSVLPPISSGSKLAHGAFWIMARRVTLVAAGVDLAFLVLFLILGSPILAWLNVGSIAMYAGAYWLLKKRFNTPALVLIWTEVLGHATIGTILIGWDSGFHYYLLMFIPAIVVSARARTVTFLLLLLLAFYLGLNAISRAYGMLAPLGNTGLWVVHTFNIMIVFAMASYTARFYYNTVRRAERKLVELATLDPLTGLSNRRNLLALAKSEMARAGRTGEPTTLIIADIDHFKEINDRHGHEAGDQVLLHASASLLQLCRANDIVSRWGGEEFLLLLPATPIESGAALAERIRNAIATTQITYAGFPVGFTFSLGVTELRAGEPISNAIARADRALYQSKAHGRDRVTVS